MTHSEKIQFIREKCIAANPSFTEHGENKYRRFHAEGNEYDGFCPKCFMTEEEASQKDCSPAVIRLADVLLAMGESDWYVGQHGRFFKWSHNLGEMVGQPINWNLRADNLQEQSDETVDFIYQLLKS